MNPRPLFSFAWQLAAFLWLLALNAAPAQPGVPLWTNRYDGPANGDDIALAVAVDGSGNVIVTGYSRSSVSEASADYATIKYSSAGVPLWTNRYNGPGRGKDEAVAVRVDGGGNVLVTGSSVGTAGFTDYATIKYSSAGVPLWTNRYNGPENSDDDATALAVDGSGNVFVTGGSYGFGIINPDYATVKYSSAGQPLWTNRCNFYHESNDEDVAKAVGVDGSGNVFVTGSSAGNGVVTVKYSGAGTPLWTNSYNGGTGASAHDLAMDGSGNVVVTGYTIPAIGNLFSATIKYSGAGVPLWTNYSDSGRAVKVDDTGNILVTGASTTKYSGSGVPLWTNYNGAGSGSVAVAVDRAGNVCVTGYSWIGSDTEYTTIAYSSAGVPLWTSRYNGPDINSSAAATAIAMDGSGNAVVTGYSWKGTSHDYTTIKYSGTPLLPIPLNYMVAANRLVLSWTNDAFSLQSGPAVQGAYTNISGATSPHTNVMSDSQRYFRLKGN